MSHQIVLECAVSYGGRGAARHLHVTPNCPGMCCLIWRPWRRTPPPGHTKLSWNVLSHMAAVAPHATSMSHQVVLECAVSYGGRGAARHLHVTPSCPGMCCLIWRPWRRTPPPCHTKLSWNVLSH